MAGLIQPTISSLTPPSSRLRTVLTTLATAISSKFESVKYALLAPEVQENGNKVAYLEFDPTDLIIESLMGSQRSFTPLRITLAMFIRSADPLVGVDLIEETLTALLSTTAINSYYNAFGTNDGFSVESVNGIEWAYGDQVGTQARMTITLSTHFLQPA